MGGIKLLYSGYANKTIIAETPIDKIWWDGLSEEWKTILLINQNLSKQHTDIYAVQNGYINRMNSRDEEDYSEMNKSLNDLNSDRAFVLTYNQFYARALKYEFVTANESIDLSTLGDLDMIYMVGGPGDLAPLKKFPNLKIVILNFCGIDLANSVRSPPLDLEPLQNLKKLQVLHCNSPVLHSIKPIEGLLALRDLRIESREVTDLSPLKKLLNLEMLTIRTKAKSGSVISKLINLKELHMDGLETVTNLSKLKRLNALSICETELAIVDASYRIKSLGFLTSLKNLEYLDLKHTSYRGDLRNLDALQNLKAITLPAVSPDNVSKFKEHHKNCVIINAYEYER